MFSFTIGRSSLSLSLYVLLFLWGSLFLHSLLVSSLFSLLNFFLSFVYFFLTCLFSFNAWVKSLFLFYNIRHGGTYDSTALSRTRWVFHTYLLYPPSRPLGASNGSEARRDHIPAAHRSRWEVGRGSPALRELLKLSRDHSTNEPVSTKC